MKKSILFLVIALICTSCRSAKIEDPPIELRAIAGITPLEHSKEGPFSSWVYSIDKPFDGLVLSIDDEVKRKYPTSRSFLDKSNGKTTWHIEIDGKIYYLTLGQGKPAATGKTERGTETTHSYLQIYNDGK